MLVPVSVLVRSMTEERSRSIVPVAGHGVALQRYASTATIEPVAVPVTLPLNDAPALTAVVEACSVRRA